MIGRGISKIFAFNFQNYTIIQCGKKNFTRSDHLQDVKFQSCFLRICSILVGNAGKFNQMKKYSDLQNRVAFLCGENNVLQLLKHRMSKIPISLKEHSAEVVKSCTRQCECVIVHRIRRGQQIFSLYSKMWDAVALRNLVFKIKKQFVKRSRELLLSAALVSAYNWEKMRITNEEMQGYIREMENVYELRKSTIICSECHLRVMFDIKVPGIKYCQCSVPKIECQSAECKDWVPFLERKDLIVWRKEDPVLRGLYAYKVHASYNDVTACDFLCVQLDAEYRKEWDQTAVELRIVDSDLLSNSDIIYWVMKWPRFFSNRDYVFNRRFSIDEREKVMVVVNKCTEHPRCPEHRGNIRVKQYWSSMVIRPHKDFGEPGIEFCLTYFDDPGVSIPSAITSWVAVSGLPDFLMRLRDAARQLAIRRKDLVYDWIPLAEPESKVEPLPELTPNSTLPSDPTPKVSLTSNQFTHQEQDSYLQLNTARLFL